MKKIELEIVALSSSVTQTHSYAVVLGEINGLRRLPIVIGAFEAQAIVVALERIKPSRPLTHDLFYNFMLSFNIELQEVLIYKLEEGIFFAQLICSNGKEIIEIDSRTSDALALAVRIGCPIFTYENILEAAGLFMDQPSAESTGEAASGTDEEVQESNSQQSHNLKTMTMEELNDLLHQVLENEDYIQAIAIRDEIKNRESRQ
ncbi:bifunctional nuclease family protein [Taibaiella koreensis]|uniref:bifunctional nuclease family protein n=1 Tax=Taibaiella koreensis TaxID=1268548 RepID=UPI000E5A0583|nr:bifunctional nuclease family protein [Taibaiella koreensis]